MEGGLVQTMIEIVAELCQLLASPPHGRLALKIVLEIVGLHWRMPLRHAASGNASAPPGLLGRSAMLPEKFGDPPG